MKDKAFDVSAPWRIDAGTDIAVNIHDHSLLGSPNHILRLDLYPIQAPSHPERHHGYWDVPMVKVCSKSVILRLEGDELTLKDLSFGEHFPPTWRGDLPLAGPAVLTVSILDLSQQPAQTIHDRSSRHLLLHNADLFPLVRATLQVTKRCNLRCRGCKREFFRGRESGHTPSAVIDSVIEASRHLASVLIHADGEPLLNPDVPDILTRLKNTMPPFGKVGLFTNAMRLNQNTARDLVDRGLNWIAVSMDGATKATMETIRLGSRLEQILENVAFAVEYGKQHAPGGIEFNVQFTIREENVHEIPAMVSLAGQLGIPYLTLGHLIKYETGEFQPVARDILAPLIDEGKEIARQNGVNLMVPPTESLEARQCPFLDEAVVHVSGDVAPCNFRKPGRPGEPNLILGNVREKSLQEIWDSPPFREFRRRLAAADFPATCEPCCFSRWGCAVRA